MDGNRDEKVRAHAYKLWEDEGRPEGRHDEHWAKAEKHVGMLGDGSEEQNLDQPGDPGARISEAEVREAFAPGGTSPKGK